MDIYKKPKKQETNNQTLIVERSTWKLVCTPDFDELPELPLVADTAALPAVVVPITIAAPPFSDGLAKIVNWVPIALHKKLLPLGGAVTCPAVLLSVSVPDAGRLVGL
jgi:hypothetical protein